MVGVFADGGWFETDVPNLSLSPPKPKGTKGKPKAKAKSQGQGKAEAKGQGKAKPSTSNKKCSSEAETCGGAEEAPEDEGEEEQAKDQQGEQDQQQKDAQKVPRQGGQIKGLDWRFTDVRVSNASKPERSYLVGAVAGEKGWKLITEVTLQASQKHRELAGNIKKEIQEKNLTKKEAIQLREQLLAET